MIIKTSKLSYIVLKDIYWMKNIKKLVTDYLAYFHIYSK